MAQGKIILHKDGHDIFVAACEGLIDITATRVSVLTHLAFAADRIDKAKAERGAAPEAAAVNASLARSGSTASKATDRIDTREA